MQIMNHWTSLTQNPIAPVAIQHVRNLLQGTYGGALSSYIAAMDEYTVNKTVLDVGVVEHAREFIDRPEWKHRLITNRASRAVGCDILGDEVAYLNQLGFDVRLVDATSDVILAERFEVVYVGDVVEHVPDAAQLLRFGARHLEENGIIVVTTPCPFWYRNLFDALRQSPFIGNVDHVNWITPFNAVELAHRAGVRLTRWHLVQNQGHDMLTRLAHRARAKLGLGNSEIFSWAYVYVFTKLAS